MPDDRSNIVNGWKQTIPQPAHMREELHKYRRRRSDYWTAAFG